MPGDPLIDGLRAAGCVFAEDEAREVRRVLGPGAHPQVVAARAAGSPLEHVLGIASFAGLDLHITAGVFVPRRRAELLATTAADLPVPAGGLVVDLGTGCGAVAAVLATRGGMWVTGCELDPAAVAAAARNGARHGFEVRAGSWWQALPRAWTGRVCLAVGYLPHVPTRELDLLPRDLRAAEPATTVDGGTDGLTPLRQVWAGAGRWLAPGAPLVTLVAAEQVAALPADARVRELARADGDVVVALSRAPGCSSAGEPQGSQGALRGRRTRRTQGCE